MAIILKPFPMMYQAEIQAMHRVLNERKPARVLEWGSGGSTIYWPKLFPNIEWISVEHNPAYAAALKGKTGKNVKLIRLDYPAYHELTPNKVGMFDLIIIDGRKRVRCANVGRDLLNHGGVAIIHDVWRERYAPVKDLYKKIQVISPPKSNSRDPRGLWLLSDPRPSRIFGIGLSRTGTNSLNLALRQLGYKACHYPSPHAVMKRARQYQALTDTPVLRHLEQLDARYPGALFILTTRELESWLVSCQAHWARTIPTDVNAWNRINVYGIADYDEAIFRQVYAEHYLKMRAYFADRPWKLLEMDITAGDGYEKLCPALGLPILKEKFPHEDAKPVEQERIDE